jgi:putative membrane protein insertion efficiency factor
MVKVRMDKFESRDLPAQNAVEPLKLDRDSLPEEIEPHVHDSDRVVEPRLRDLPFTLWNIPRYILLALIRLYQATVSRTLPPDTCRFYPTCSHYGYQAIYKYGALKGGLMAAWRVLRCNPFNKGGFDPVP